MVPTVDSLKDGTSRSPYRRPNRALLGCTQVRTPDPLSWKERFLRGQLHHQVLHKLWALMKSTYTKMQQPSRTSGEVSECPHWNEKIGFDGFVSFPASVS